MFLLLGTPFRKTEETPRVVPSACLAVPGTCRALRGTCRAVPGTCRAVPGTCRAVPGTCLAVPGACLAVPVIWRAIPRETQVSDRIWKVFAARSCHCKTAMQSRRSLLLCLIDQMPL